MTAKQEKRTRSVTIDRANGSDKGIPIALSSENVVQGEILSHADGHVDMSRAVNGLPVLWHHGRTSEGNLPLGIVDDIRIDADRVMRGNLKLSKGQHADKFRSLIDEGMLKDASIGAFVDPDSIEWRADDEVAVIRSWMPYELSLTPTPLDGSVGINRSDDDTVETTKQTINRGETMDTENDKGAAGKVSPSLIDIDHATEKGRALEAERRDAIDKVVENYLNIEGVNTLRKRAIAEKLDPVDVAIELNTILARGVVIREKAAAPAQAAEPSSADAPQSEDKLPRTSQGEQHVEKTLRAIEEAILVRGNAVFDKDGKIDRDEVRRIRAENHLTNRTLIEMVNEYAKAAGVEQRGASSQIEVANIMRHRSGVGGMANADLPALVENIMNKMMMTPLTPAEENWRNLAKTSSLTDFKQTSRVNLGSASDLKEIANGGPIQRGYIKDFKEYLQARTFGVELVVEYQTLRNDDVGALTQLPLEIRRKGNRKVGDLVWAILTANPTLNATGAAVFTAGQGNLITAGAAPSVTTIEAGIAWMGTQQAPSPTGDDTNDPGDYLNIAPQYLAVPKALEGRANSLMLSAYDPDAASGSQTVNTVQRRFEVIAEARLDAFNANGWFLLADAYQHPTIEVGFLDGQETPVVMQEDDWSTRGVKYAVWHDFDAKPMDYRGMYYNDGVT